VFHSNRVIGSPEMQVLTRVQSGVMVIKEGAIMPGSNPMLIPEAQSPPVLELCPPTSVLTPYKSMHL
jgi:hypothetical protein